MDLGIQNAFRQAPLNPLPLAWLGRSEAPQPRPDWAAVSGLTATQHRNLLSQMAYTLSDWNYSKIGNNKELGRFQIDVPTLEAYGLLVAGSFAAYGTDAVNYQHCWRSSANTYAEYLSDVANQQDFLTNQTAQELLAYQRVFDLFNEAVRINAIQGTDTADVVAGMIFVAWVLGVGVPASGTYPQGTGSYAWRYSNVGSAAAYFNAGRYAVAVLSK